MSSRCWDPGLHRGLGESPCPAREADRNPDAVTTASGCPSVHLPLPGPGAAAGAECRGGRGMPHTQAYRRGTQSRSFGLLVTGVECLPLRVLEIIK